MSSLLLRVGVQTEKALNVHQGCSRQRICTSFCELARHVIHVKTCLIFSFLGILIHRIELNGIGQQLNKNMQLHVLHCVCSFPVYLVPTFHYEAIKSERKVDLIYETPTSAAWGSFNGMGWMHLVKSFHGKMPQGWILRLAVEKLTFLEHFPLKHRGFQSVALPTKKHHNLFSKHLECEIQKPYTG